MLKERVKCCISTEKGMKLIEIVPEELKSPETTGKWEKGLSSIAKNKMDPERFMDSIIEYVKQIVDESKKSDIKVSFPKESKKNSKRSSKKTKGLGKCPLCNKGSIMENSKAFYCSQWKAGCKFALWKNSLEIYGLTITAEMVERLLKDKVIKGISYTLPQTQERYMGDLSFMKNGKGMVEFINGKKLKNESSTV